MSVKPTQGVAIVYARLLGETLKEEGIDLTGEGFEFLEQGLDDSEVIRIELWLRLMAAAERLTGDDAIGLRVGQRIQPHHLGLLGYALMASGSVGELVQRYARYHCTIVKGFPMELQKHGKNSTLNWASRPELSMFQSHVCAVTAMLFLFRAAIGDSRFTPSEIGFTHPPPENIDSYVAVLGPNLSFDNNAMSFSIPADLLSRPLINTDKKLVSILRAQLEQSLPDQHESSDSRGFLTTMHHAIGESLATSIPGISAIAAEMNMSKRTLSRRLSDRNTSFREELFKVQEQLAKSYLEDNRLPLSEIAFLVGFENQSSFTRAFKRWVGLTPKYWQRTAGQRSIGQGMGPI